MPSNSGPAAASSRCWGTRVSDAPIETWDVAKPQAIGGKGVVAAQHVDAAWVGADVLEAGGNAVDAAVAAAFALTVAEPWMSGLGGGGFAIVRDGKTGTVKVVDFGMIASTALNPNDYPLDEAAGSVDWFGFPAVVEDRNQRGFKSMAVPGTPAGYAALLDHFGTRSWAEMLAPARAMARQGHRVTWWTTLQVAAEAHWLREYLGSRSVWMPAGLPPSASEETSYLDLGSLADTLDRLAEAGPRDFYEGEIARRLIDDLREGGSPISADDLRRYQATVVDPITRDRSGHRYHLLPGYTAGPTFAAALDALPADLGTAPNDATFQAYARTMIAAYKRRLEVMGHAGDVGDRSCTTHLSAIDADGTMVVITTTLLSRFGSRVVLPATGILMNNGVNWFDPRPGRPNSVAAGERPLSNMAPVIVTDEAGSAFGFGASGGRKIMPATFQLSSFVADFGMPLDAALLHPRIDISLVEQIIADARFDPSVVTALESVAPVERAEATAFPARYAIPNGVAFGSSFAPDGPTGAAHPFGPLNAAVAAG